MARLVGSARLLPVGWLVASLGSVLVSLTALTARVVVGSVRLRSSAQIGWSSSASVDWARRVGSVLRLVGFSVQLGSLARRHVGTSACRLTFAAIAPGRNAAADLCIHSDINVRQRRTWRTSHGPTNFGNGTPTSSFSSLAK